MNFNLPGMLTPSAWRWRTSDRADRVPPHRPDPRPGLHGNLSWRTRTAGRKKASTARTRGASFCSPSPRPRRRHRRADPERTASSWAPCPALPARRRLTCASATAPAPVDVSRTRRPRRRPEAERHRRERRAGRRRPPWPASSGPAGRPRTSAVAGTARPDRRDGQEGGGAPGSSARPTAQDGLRPPSTGLVRPRRLALGVPTAGPPAAPHGPRGAEEPSVARLQGGLPGRRQHPGAADDRHQRRRPRATGRRRPGYRPEPTPPAASAPRGWRRRGEAQQTDQAADAHRRPDQRRRQTHGTALTPHGR
ncbi:hypothetical protein SVIOM342S_04071 [Streptomyces violaceorubidus]